MKIVEGGVESEDLLVRELYDVLQKYEGAVSLSSAVGVLEILKYLLIKENGRDD